MSDRDIQCNKTNDAKNAFLVNPSYWVCLFHDTAAVFKCFCRSSLSSSLPAYKAGNMYWYYSDLASPLFRNKRICRSYTRGQVSSSFRLTQVMFPENTISYWNFCHFFLWWLDKSPKTNEDATMLKTIKRYLLYAVLIGLVYLLLANHYIYIGGKDFRILKKESLNLKYTFFSIQSKSPANIIKIDDLRWAGIGDILYEQGLVTKDQQVSLESKYEYEYENE